MSVGASASVASSCLSDDVAPQLERIIAFDDIAPVTACGDVVLFSDGGVRDLAAQAPDKWHSTALWTLPDSVRVYAAPADEPLAAQLVPGPGGRAVLVVVAEQHTTLADEEPATPGGACQYDIRVFDARTGAVLQTTPLLVAGARVLAAPKLDRPRPPASDDPWHAQLCVAPGPRGFGVGTVTLTFAAATDTGVACAVEQLEGHGAAPASAPPAANVDLSADGRVAIVAAHLHAGSSGSDDCAACALTSWPTVKRAARATASRVLWRVAVDPTAAPAPLFALQVFDNAERRFVNSTRPLPVTTLPAALQTPEWATHVAHAVAIVFAPGSRAAASFAWLVERVAASVTSIGSSGCNKKAAGGEAWQFRPHGSSKPFFIWRAERLLLCSPASGVFASCAIDEERDDAVATSSFLLFHDEWSSVVYRLPSNPCVEVPPAVGEALPPALVYDHVASFGDYGTV